MGKKKPKSEVIENQDMFEEENNDIGDNGLYPNYPELEENQIMNCSKLKINKSKFLNGVLKLEYTVVKESCSNNHYFESAEVPCEQFVELWHEIGVELLKLLSLDPQQYSLRVQDFSLNYIKDCPNGWFTEFNGFLEAPGLGGVIKVKIPKFNSFIDYKIPEINKARNPKGTHLTKKFTNHIQNLVKECQHYINGKRNQTELDI